MAVYLAEPPPAGRPPYAIRLAVAAAPGDVAVEVCPVPPAAAAAVPGHGHLIDVFVDGRTAAEGPAAQFALRLAPGAHTVSAELVQSNHLEFVPRAVTSTTTVTVPAGPGGTLPAVTC